MIAIIDRTWITRFSVCGRLMLDGAFFCYTLEPPEDDPLHPCIPDGTFDVLLEPSPKFSKLFGREFITPHVLNVPNRSYIEWHPGNKPSDTEGCLVVGDTHLTDFVEHSDVTFAKLIELLPERFTATYVTSSLQLPDAA